MTTLEFMAKQLEKHKYNLNMAINRNSPEEDVKNIKNKIKYYTEVCDLLKQTYQID